MTFLNATMLFGLAASALPIVMHLVGRQKPKRYEFPAIRFLKQRLETNRRRLRVRHWTLLLLRMLALAGIALALAQPLIHAADGGTWLSIGLMGLVAVAVAGAAAWGYVSGQSASVTIPLGVAAAMLLIASGGWGLTTALSGPPPVSPLQQPMAVAIVVDNSPRLGYVEDGQARLQIAKDWANWIVGHLTETSSIAIVDRSPRPVIPAIDLAAALRSIDRWKTLQVVQPIHRRIDSALKLLAKSEFDQKTIYVLTDLTQSSWSSQTPIPQREDVTIRIIDIGATDDANRSLGTPQLSSESLAQGLPASISVDVSRVGTFPSDDATIELELFERQVALPVQRDGEIVFPETRVIDRKRIQVPEGATGEVTLELPPLEPGTHQGRVTLTGQDALEVDNVRYLSVSVNNPPRVLLVSNDKDEARVIASALALPSAGRGQQVDYEVESINYAELNDASLPDFRVVGLLDPPRPGADAGQAIAAWIAGGGKAFVCIGPGWADTDGGDEVIEDDLFGTVVRAWRVPNPGRALELVSPTHRSLQAFAKLRADIPWQKFPIHRYWQIEQQESDILVARFGGSQHPAIVDRRIGSGRLLMMTTPVPGVAGPARRWNDLLSAEDAWPAFLLIRGCFNDLADRDPGTLNVITGQPVGLRRDKQDATRYQLFSQATTPVVVEATGDQIRPGIAVAAGNYWLRSSGATIGYSANLRTADTDMQRIESDVLTDVFGADRYQWIRNREEIDWEASGGKPSKPFYAQIMLMVCAVFVLEQILANRFYSTA